MGDDNKIVKFPDAQTNEFFPPSARIKSIRFYGPAIKQSHYGPLISPAATCRFEVPITEEQAKKLIEETKKLGGIMGKIDDEFFFIPWPCAAIYFDFVKS